MNYTDKVLTVRVEGVGVFEVPADKGSTLALEVSPKAYLVYVSIPGLPERWIQTGYWCTYTDDMKVPAKRALVLPIRQYPEDWGAQVDLAMCPTYEDPDKP